MVDVVQAVAWVGVRGFHTTLDFTGPYEIMKQMALKDPYYEGIKPVAMWDKGQSMSCYLDLKLGVDIQAPDIYEFYVHVALMSDLDGIYVQMGMPQWRNLVTGETWYLPYRDLEPAMASFRDWFVQNVLKTTYWYSYTTEKPKSEGEAEAAIRAAFEYENQMRKGIFRTIHY